MAKKSQPTGPGVGMIVTLVFFVLATVILGVTTWLGFDGQKQLEEDTKKAKADADNLKKRVDEETAQKIVNRIAVGTDTPEDRENLLGAARANQSAVLTEIKLLTDKLGAAGAF